MPTSTPLPTSTPVCGEPVRAYADTVGGIVVRVSDEASAWAVLSAYSERDLGQGTPRPVVVEAYRGDAERYADFLDGQSARIWTMPTPPPPALTLHAALLKYADYLADLADRVRLLFSADLSGQPERPVPDLPNLPQLINDLAVRCASQ